MDTDLQSIQEARRLVDAAYSAWSQFEEFSEGQVETIVKAVSDAGVSHAEKLARMAVEETGFGNVPDKTAKNLFASDAVYRAIRPLRTVGIVREDPERQVIDVASPVGVIAAIVPSTNPTSTTIYKALISLKGRNGLVFSPHPSAVKSISETVRLIAEAAESHGAPPGLVSCMEMPTLEGTRELMGHRKIALILATGGPGLVRAAYSAGKPAFGVGAGNVPAYIERTAAVPKAVSDILTGKCFDNGTLCSSEQSVICDEVVRDQVLAELRLQGAHICSEDEQTRLEAVIQTPRGTLNTGIVGRHASRIAEMAGIQVEQGTRALVGFAEGVGPGHPLSMEKLSPVLAFYTVDGWEEGCRKCIEILNYGGLGHTLALHSQDQMVVRQFALKKPAFRICVNTPAALGAVGYTTNLFPSMTLGCGAAGGNITSDNISPLHLINLKRVAYGVRDYDAPASATSSRAGATLPPGPGPQTRSMRTTRTDPDSYDNRREIAEIVDGWLGRRAPAASLASDTPTRHPSQPATKPSVETIRPPLTSYAEIEPFRETSEEVSGDPVSFVCEDDVRAALKSQTRIYVDGRTIITPSARDLGEREGVFIAAH